MESRWLRNFLYKSIRRFDVGVRKNRSFISIQPTQSSLPLTRGADARCPDLRRCLSGWPKGSPEYSYRKPIVSRFSSGPQLDVAASKESAIISFENKVSGFCSSKRLRILFSRTSPTAPKNSKLAQFRVRCRVAAVQRAYN